MKVYELAKDLDLKSVELVDKLRKDWQLPVKNHMQKLSDKDVERIKNFFKKTKNLTQAAKKKRTKVVKRKKPVGKAPKISKEGPTEAQAKTPRRKNIIRRRISAQKQEEINSLSSQQEAVKQKIEQSEATSVSEAKSTVRVEVGSQEAGRSIRSGLVLTSVKDILKTSHEDREKAEAEKKKPKKVLSDKEGQGKQFRSTDFRKREMIFQPKKKRLSSGYGGQKTQITKPKSHKRMIKMYDHISLEDLSHQLGVKKVTVITKMRQEGLFKTNEDHKNFDYDTAFLVSSFFDFKIKNLARTQKEALQFLAFGDLNAEKKIKTPVVTVMGHVNHGKTTLLDYIRKSQVAKKEAGGITQHIGAYSVPTDKNFVTFIDTPGHSAFTNMRARGAQVTDIVVIVVSADDGVQPQTVEAINHAKSAKVPIIVAINKTDLPSAQPEEIKKQLTNHELVPEEWGGDTIFVLISALKGDGIEALLEHIHLLAELHELKANPDRSALGVVIESKVEKGKGPIMSLLIQDGTLKTGQILVAGNQMGRARRMMDSRGTIVQSVGPGQPVEISGFSELPQTGDMFYAVKNEKEAKKWLIEKQKKFELKIPEEKKQLSIEELLMRAHTNKKKILNIVLKADVLGSLEAIRHSIEELNTDEVEAKIIHSNLSSVNESDVLLTDVGSAILLCFNVGIDLKAQKLITEKGISVQSYNIIYDLLEDLEKKMASLLDPEIQEVAGGTAEVQQVFHVSDIGLIAGCRVTKGKIQNNHLVRLKRNDELVHEGEMGSLKRFKELAKEVHEGQECGIGIKQCKDIKEGDVIETFLRKEIKKERLQ